MIDFFFGLFLMAVFGGFMVAVVYNDIEKSHDANFPSPGKLVAFAVLGLVYTGLFVVTVPITLIIWALIKSDLA